MKSADRTANELAEFVIGDRLEPAITDADGFLRVAAAIEAAPQELAVETARRIRQTEANARRDAGLCPSCGAGPLRPDLCSCGDVLGPGWEPAEADV
jgi:hypothetical protein